MKRPIALRVAVLTFLLIAVPNMGMALSCSSQPKVGPKPAVGIMVSSNIAEAGSSFMVVGESFEPNQKVWAAIKFRGTYSVQVYCQANEEGSIHPVIDIPEDVVLGDYEVRIYTGEDAHNRHLFTTLPIHIQAKAE